MHCQCLCYDFYSIVTPNLINCMHHFFQLLLKSTLLPNLFISAKTKNTNNQHTTTKQTKITSWNFQMTLNKLLLILNNHVSIIGYYLLMLDLQFCKEKKKRNWSLERRTIIFYKYRITSCKLPYLSAAENSQKILNCEKSIFSKVIRQLQHLLSLA